MKIEKKYTQSVVKDTINETKNTLNGINNR